MASALKEQVERDARLRATAAARVPDEPAEGEAGSCLLCFHVGKQLVWRRFESCNTREDMLNYVKSLPLVNPNSPIELQNVTTAPNTVLSDSLAGYTLQRLDLWPSGHIEVRCAA